MLHVIERIVNFLAADENEDTVEAGVGTAEYALIKLHTEKSVLFHNNTIYNITEKKGDYTIEFSKNGNKTPFTINLTTLPDKTKPQQYSGRGPSQSFTLIRTESDLVSFMASTQ